MNTIIGNKDLLSALLSSVRENRVAGCYIIEGADGTGKLTTARYFAAALCCQSKNAKGEPCGVCHSCKNIPLKSYIDVVEVRPEEEGKRITINQIREMLRTTHISATEGDWRIFIIDEGQNMKKEAQNAILKSIEEPSDKTVFLLLTSDKTKLLPTVRSRAVLLKTTPLSDEELINCLKERGYAEGDINDVVLLSGGSLGKAISLLQDPSTLAMQKKTEEYFRAIMNGAGFTGLCAIFPPASLSRSDIALFLPMIKNGLRDLMVKQQDKEAKCSFFTDEKFVLDLASITSPKNAVKLFTLCEELGTALEQNVNVFSALSGLHLTAQNLTKSEK